jgi:O-antigen/teichoic acid export membrane protein
LILSILGSEDFGLFNLITGVIVMFTFINVALSASSQRALSIAQGQMNIDKQISIFNISLVIHILAAIIILIILFISSFFIFDGFLNIDPSKVQSSKFIFLIVIIITLINIISVPFDATLNAHENFFYISVLGLFETVLKFLSALALSFILYNKIITYSIFLLLIAFIIFILKGLYVLEKYPEAKINLFKYFDKDLFNEMMSFARWGFLSSSISILTNSGGNLLINNFFGTKVNAAQAVSGQINGQVGAVSNVFLSALNPILFKSFGANDKTLFRQSIMSGCKLAFLSFSIIAIPVIFEMNFLFNFWLKEIPNYTIIFCSLFMTCCMLGQLTISLSSAISATGRIKNFTIVKSIADVIPYIFIYLFFKVGYPPQTLYVILLIFEFFRIGIILYFGKLLCEIDLKEFFINNILKLLFISFTSIISIVLIQLISPPSLFRLLLVVFFSSTITLLMYYFIGFTQKEKSIVESIFLQIRGRFSLYISRNYFNN